MSASRLHPDDLAALADLIADRIASRLLSAASATGTAPTAHRAVASAQRSPEGPEDVMTPAEAAAYIGRSRDFVYEHADALGVRRLPGQRRSRLSFRRADLDAAMTRRSGSGESGYAGSPAPPPSPAPSPARSAGSVLDALPRREVQPFPVTTKAGPRRANDRPPTTRRKPSPPADPTPQRRGSGDRGRSPLKEA